MKENTQPMPEIELTDDDRQKIQKTAESIDLSDSGLILYYGTAEQQKLAYVSDKLFRMVRDDSSSKISGQMEELVKELREFSDLQEKCGFFGWLFRNRERKNLRKRYEEAEKNIGFIAADLEKHRNQLLRDFVMLNKLYDALLEHTRALTIAVDAGQRKLDAEPSVKKELRERFEKRLHDLKLSRIVCLQTLTQIRILQECNTALSEKIHSLLNNTVSLWKNQMAIALGIKNTAQAMEGMRKANGELIGVLDTVQTAEAESRRESGEIEQLIKKRRKNRDGIIEGVYNA